MAELKGLDTPGLLRLYAGILAELKACGASRGMNSPMADYAEQLVAKHLDAEILPPSNAGYDLVGRDGTRYEVKARRLSASPSCRQLSAIRGLDAHKFDYLVGVLFNADFTVNRAAMIPWEVVTAKATFVKHTNAWNFFLIDDVWALPGVEDLVLEANQERRRLVPAVSLGHDRVRTPRTARSSTCWAPASRVWASGRAASCWRSPRSWHDGAWHRRPW